ncbi:MAG: head-tail connector protein [Holosporales bacterium]|jgi:uncharacterized phiE125 gp8 family phage protein|nr:head-tail connector protein [Holosporales bacterium]
MFNILEKSDTLAINLKKVKNYLRIDHNEDDDNLKHLIKAATSSIEKNLERSFLLKTFEKIVFTRAGKDGITRIKLSFPPLLRILSVEKKTGNGEFKEIYNYLISTESAIPHILLREANCTIRVRYIAGYGDLPSHIPHDIRQAILLLVSEMYENQSGEKIIRDDSILNALLSPYRIVSLI